jgi:hypothetical protein
VQHRRDRLVLVAAVLHHQPADDEQVSEIRDLGTRPPLMAVHLLRQRDRLQEAIGECRRGKHGLILSLPNAAHIRTKH